MIVFFCSRQLLIQILNKTIILGTDYGRPVRKPPSLHGQKSTPTPKFLGTAEAYYVCHIGPNFQISLIYAFIGCPQSVALIQSSTSDHTITKINQLPRYCNYTISYEVNLHCSPRPYLFPIRKKYPTGFCFLSHVQYSQSHIIPRTIFFFDFGTNLYIISLYSKIKKAFSQ